MNTTVKGSNSASRPQPQRPSEPGPQEYVTLAEAAAVLRLHPPHARSASTCVGANSRAG